MAVYASMQWSLSIVENGKIVHGRLAYLTNIRNNISGQYNE